MSRPIAWTLALWLLLIGGAARAADTLQEELAGLQQRWAIANYELRDKPRLAALELLVQDAEALTARYPQRAEGWIWSGIIRATLANAKGGLGALGLAKAAKADLERAIALDPTALEGSAYTSLGVLYAKVPGWPIGFGDAKKAQSLLQEALRQNPNGIDANYFYGQYLYEHGQRAAAETYLLRAANAAPRPGRELADSGRQKETAELLAKLRAN